MRRIFTLFAILFSFSAQAQWIAMAPLPLAVSQHVGVEHPNGKMYVIGGYTTTSPSITPTNATQIYNPATNTWTSGTVCPVSASGAAGCLGTDGKIYFIGGSTNGSTTGIQGAYRYDPAGNTWETLTNLPSGRFNAGAVSYGGKVYVMGGFSGGGVNTVSVFDIAAGTWSSGSAMPDARFAFKPVVTAGGDIYVAGGRSASSTTTTTIFKYDIASNAWTTLAATLPAGMNSNATTVANNGKVYITGGRQSTSIGAGPFLSTTSILDPTTGTLTAGTSLPVATGEHSLVTLGSKIFCTGGATGSTTSANYALTILQGPAGINNGVELWLDGSNVNNTTPTSNPANTTNINVWKDVSGNNNDATVLGGQSAGVLNTAAINGKSVVKFNRASQFNGSVYNVAGVDIRATTMPKTTMFTVYRQGTRNAGEWHGIWGNDNQNFDRFFMPTADGIVSPATDGIVSVGLPTGFIQIPNSGVVGATRLLTAVYDNGVSNGSTIYFNGQPVQTVTDGTDPLDALTSLRVGWDGDDNPFNGDIAEMIVYDRKLTDCEIIAVNRYLGYKYGVALSTAAISTPNPVYCSGGSSVLTASSGTTYQWLLNGAVIGAANGSTYTASTPGSYRVIVGNGICSDTSSAVAVNEVGPVIYVDSTTVSSGTGLSWASPKKTLAEALIIANAVSCGVSIYVAKGTYYPMAGSSATTSRDSSLRITRNNIKVYGGFPAGGSTFAARNIAANLTILSGDIGTANDSTDNSYHVMTIVGNASNNIDINTVVDGFTVRGGNNSGVNTVFTVSGIPVYTGAGGGINCAGNTAGAKSSPLLANITFTRNSAIWGGGLYMQAHDAGISSPTVQNCTFLLNTCDYDGGAVHGYTNGGQTSPVFTGCTFTANKALIYYGGAIYSANGNVTLTNCNFTANTTTYLGGAVSTHGTNSTTVTNCTFSANSAAGDGGGILDYSSGNLNISNSRFLSNTAGGYGGGIVNTSKMGLRNTIFSGNTCGNGGGGAVHSNNGGTDTAINCVFTGNTSGNVGGAIHHSFNGQLLRVVNSTFSANSAGNGGAIFAESNVANSDMTNSIVWGNTATSNPGVIENGSANLTVTYSNIQGGYGGTGNYSSNPLFFNAADPDGADNVWATADDGLKIIFPSSAINSGNNAATAIPATDITGATRTLGGTVDRGAYETLITCGTGIVYVDSSKAVSGDGSSWAQAFKSVTEGLAMANQCPAVTEVWVAKGTYYSMEGLVKTSNRDSSFRILRNGIKVYGGFPSGGSTFAARNFTTNLTVLSGDIGVANDSTDNSYHVMTIVGVAGNNIDSSTVVDGFTVTGSKGDNVGNFTINGMIVERGAGGGILCGGRIAGSKSSPKLANIIFIRNAATWGGGVYCMAHGAGISSPVIRDCSFSANRVTGDGGAIQGYTDGAGQVSPIFSGSAFNNNFAAGIGGAVRFSVPAPAVSAASFKHCTFTGNSVTIVNSSWGGAVSIENNATVSIDSSSFTGNKAQFGGGISCGFGTVAITVTNTTFTANVSASYGGGIDAEGVGTATVTGCTFYANNGPLGSGMHQAGSGNTILASSLFDRDTATNVGAGFRAAGSGTTTISGCRFTDNFSANGGALHSNGGAVTGRNLVFNRNRTNGAGAAVTAASNTSTLINCVIDSNYLTGGTGGGGIRIQSGATVVLNNSTLNRNSSAGSVAGANSILAEAGSTITLNNSIVWGAAAQQVAGPGTVTYNYSNVKGIVPAANSQNSNPQFTNQTDPDGADNTWATGDDGLHLTVISPSLNTGSNALIPAGITTDIAGAARIQQTTVDMGAYEGIQPIFCQGGTRVYVDSSKAGSGNGTSWAEAYKTVWEALTVADSCTGIAEIWVARGTYYPMDGVLTKATSRDSALRIKRNGIKIYGGFAGNEIALTARNISTNPTILSGNIGAVNDSTDNAFHVMTIIGKAGANIDTNTVVDGFTIRDGYSYGDFSQVSVYGMTLYRGDGGGINCGGVGSGSNSSPKLENLVFTANTANWGGGLALQGHTNGQSSPIIRNCVFNRNTTNNQGGGMHVQTDGAGNVSPKVYNSSFTGNRTRSSQGGGIYQNGNGTLALRNVDISNDTALLQGGGIFAENGANIIIDSGTFSNNSSVDGGAINSRITGWIQVRNSRFFNNYGRDYGGAITSVNGPMTVLNTVFSGNSADNGGAIHSNVNASDTIINSVFIANNATLGGAIQIGGTGKRMRVINSTIYGNTATDGGGISYQSNVENGDITNSIIWGNIAATNPGIRIAGSSTLAVTYSTVQGGYTGTGNINSNPQFANSGDPDGADNVWATADDGLHLTTLSPAYNSGLNAAVPAGVTTDIAGAARIQNTTVDMGAYEGALAFACPTVARLYVDSSKAGSGDGTSWNDAYKTVWEALTVANQCPVVTEIWVAKGTYYPMNNAVTLATSTDSALRITRNGIKVYGGFAGNESLLSARNITANPTVLSGNIGLSNDSTDNSSHVLMILSTPTVAIDSTTRVDGFTITGAQGRGSNYSYSGTQVNNYDGGGILIQARDAGAQNRAIIQNCIITRNFNFVGGGIYCGGYDGGVSAPYIRNSTISNNRGADVGGIHSYSGGTGSAATPAISDCIFRNNSADQGGAMGVFGNTSLPTVVNSVFENNTAVNTGGAVNVYFGGFTATNSVFYNNRTTAAGASGGGAISVPGGWTVTVNNCTFYNNTTGSTGTPNSNTIANFGTFNANNTIIWGSAAVQVGGTGTSNYSYSDVKGLALAAPNTSSNPQFTNPADPDGADNIWATADDGLQLSIISSPLNAGSNALIPAGITTDIRGAARIQQTTVDMGAYEGIRPIFCQAGTRLYVDSSKTVSGDGTSWSEAYKTVWEALTVADSCTGVAQIWVAKGTYYPMAGAMIKATSRDSSLRIHRSGIKIYGGFAGNETLLTARNITVNTTVLSGDLGTLNDSTDNAYHVVTVVRRAGSTIDTSTRIDGFTITRGFANNPGTPNINGVAVYSVDGAGLFIGGTGTTNLSSPYVANCTITRNTADFGGGAYCGMSSNSGGSASPWFENCVFSQNTATNNGGALVHNTGNNVGQPRQINCSFIANRGQSGGAVRSSGNTQATYTGCTFTENTAVSTGGAIINLADASMTIDSSKFMSNHGGDHGGGFDQNGNGTVTLRKTVFYNNDAIKGGNGAGGGLAVSGGIVNVINSVFADNKANGTSDFGGGAIITYGGATNVFNTSFSNNTTTSTSNPGSNAVSSYNGATTLNNSIVWGAAAQQAGATGGTLQYNYSIVKGLNLASPNSSSNPQYVNAADPDGADNIWATADDGLRLTIISDALNAGSNALIPAGITTDITGAARIQQTTVDMGAYEGATTICQPVARIYVDSSKAFSGNGSSWNEAYKTVWEALTIANQCPTVAEIWVAKGTYYPMVRSSVRATSRDSSLRIMRNGIKLYGGFSGNETLLTARNITANPTLLSGEIGVQNDSTDNSFHTMTIVRYAGAAVDTSTRVDGFSFVRGNANGGSNFTVNGVTMNQQDGGAIFVTADGTTATSPYIINCAFNGNAALFGGAVYTGSSGGNGLTSLRIESCTFTNNFAQYFGGALLHFSDVSVTNTINCTFTGNKAVAQGGAVFSQSPHTDNYTGCIFTSNESGDGGAVYNNGVTAVNAANCRIISNKANANGGGWVSNSGTITMRSMIFSGNTAQNNGGALVSSNSATFSIGNTVFAGNATVGSSGDGGGVLVNYGGTVTLVNSTLSNNTTASTTKPTANAISLVAGATVVLNNTIVWGTAAQQVANAGGTVAYNYSLVRGLSPVNAPNLAADPQFINAADPDGADNTWATSDDGLRLTPCSPAIGAGSNALAATAGLTTDITGAARVQLTTVDMGAYEMPYAGTGLPDIIITKTTPAPHCAGNAIAFSATLTAPGSPVSVAWFRNATQLQTGTSTTFSTTTLSNNDTVFAVLYNAACGLYDTSNRIVVPITPLPAAPAVISGATAVCAGVATPYSVSVVPGATAYNWTLPSGWTGATSSNAISVIPSATSGTITVTAANNCGISTSPATLAVTSTTVPATPGAISGATATCTGIAQTYTVPNVTGVTYAWTLPSGWSGASTTNTITATPGPLGGTVAVAAANYCGTSATATLAVSGSAAPAAPVSVTGPTAVCAGVAQTYSVAATPGATTYSWNVPAGWTVSGATNTNTITLIPTATGGSVSVQAVNPCGTSAASAALAVSSTTIPAAPGAVSGATAVCAGVAQTYTVTPVTNATSYNWTLPSGWSGTSATASISTVPTATGGNLTVSASNYCGTSAASAALAVTSTQTPAVPGAISGATAVCAGVAQTYTVAPVAGATSYTWTLGGSLTSAGSTTTSIVVTPGATGGTITVSALNYCGTSAASATLNVSGSAVPATPATPAGNAAVCTGTTNTYTVGAVAGTTTYNWTLPSGWSASSLTTAGPSIAATATATAVSGSITASATNYCGTSAVSAPLAVSVTATPAQPGGVSGPVVVCAATTQNYSITAVTGATSYVWTVPSGWTITTVPATGTAIAVTTGGSGAGSVTVRAVNTCGTSAVQSLAVTTNTVPAQPGLISGAAAICGGTSQTYSVPPLGTATSYAWTLPAGFTGASATTSINTIAGTAGGTIQVAGVNACGTGAVRTLAVAVTNVPGQPGAISGLAGLCYGGSQTYGIAAVSGATSYAWTLPGAWTATTPVTGTTIGLNAGTSAGGVLSVVAINGCGAGTPRTLAVNAEPYAVVSVSPAGSGPNGEIALCVGDTVSLHALSTPGAGVQTGWQWYYNGTAMSGANDSVWRVYAQGTYRVVATTANGCRDTAEAVAAASVNVPVIVNVVASPGVNIQSGQTVTFTATVTNGGSAPQWRWYRNGAVVTGVTGNVYVSSTLADGDQVWAWARSNRACTEPDTANSNVLKIRIATGVAGGAGVVDKGRGIRLYPNPTGGRFTVERLVSNGSNTNGGGYGGGQVELVMSNGLGQVVERVISERDGSGGWKVRMVVDEKIANGVYWLRVIERDASGAVTAEEPVSLPFVLQR